MRNWFNEILSRSCLKTYLSCFAHQFVHSNFLQLLQTLSPTPSKILLACFDCNLYKQGNVINYADGKLVDKPGWGIPRCFTRQPWKEMVFTTGKKCDKQGKTLKARMTAGGYSPKERGWFRGERTAKMWGNVAFVGKAVWNKF